MIIKKGKNYERDAEQMCMCSSIFVTHDCNKITVKRQLFKKKQEFLADQ